jgi:type VI secretion system protein ImpA
MHKRQTSVNLPDGFDLEALLVPIPGDAPQGIDVREDYSAQSPYGRARDARSNARDAEKQAEAPDPDGPPPADPVPLWRALRDIGLKLLVEKTKDLEVASWLTEAFVRSHGLSGLAACSDLIARLASQYWDDVYPLPDEYGMETRVAPITGLNGQGGGGSLMAPLFKLKLYDRPDGTPIALYQYNASSKLGALDAASRQQRIEAGAIPFDEIEKEARTVGRIAMGRLRADATAALQSWEAMAAILDEKAGADTPSTSQVRDMLREIAEIAARYAPEEEVPAETGADNPEMAGSGAGSEAGGMAGTGIRGTTERVVTREDALRNLEAIAAFFRKSEPHSPLSFTLDDAVRRARLPLLDLLDEVIGDRSVRDAILTTLGIRPPPPEE